MTNPQFQSSHSNEFGEYCGSFSLVFKFCPRKGIQDGLGLWIPPVPSTVLVARGTWILDSGFGIPDSESWIPDSSQGPVVRKPIGTNPWLNFNPGVFFSLSIALSRIISSIPVLECSTIKL